MMVLVSYDVRVSDPGGARRLRRLARACLDFGQRAQYSVFELEVDQAQWVVVKRRLSEIIDPECDSLRFYYLGRNWSSKVEHIGAKPLLDLNGPLVM
ncbi:CRISPR-associated endonuclease Cas2 [Pseudoduganella danionis]|uniref:CRISPR-associated endoribonuclease Cas2 n=2 Tax=Pseudoduganella danionis TaxID=1890295 RepID=A0ABW9SMY9_9BURK|nr:CRISPR-associated endonuclease Cas2 [Pseudoduganella danionis]MTW32976.1 CRISPR-associated endonuclease Cas2 [Pseudoduganella danionis]